MTSGFLISSPARALLLLATLSSARADWVTTARCAQSHDRLLTAETDHNATVLDFSGCGISEPKLDDFNGTALPNLQYILLSHNYIKHINPAVFVPVSDLKESLDLSNNSLNEVPVFGAYSLFPRLRYLKLSHNVITSIRDNNTFSSLIQLQGLILTHNNIEYIEPGIFQPLHQLIEIRLDDNKLVSIPASLFNIKSLEVLLLGTNLIEYVAPHAFEGNNLSKLHINDNRLGFLPEDFLLELKGLSGPYTGSNIGGDWWNSFNFNDNPWQCGCVLELFAEVMRLDVRYYTYTYSWYHNFKGAKPECVFRGRIACDRSPPTPRPTSK